MQRTRFPKPVWRYGLLKFFGSNIVASEFDEWKRYRKVSAPAFSEVGATTRATLPLAIVLSLSCFQTDNGTFSLTTNLYGKRRCAS